MAEKSAQKQRGPGRPFKKGVSGNPSGKPRGTLAKTTQIAQALVDGQSAELIQKAVELALGGDTTCIRILVDRILPPRKERPVEVDLPALEGAADLPATAAAIIQAGASGELTPSETSTLIGALVGYGKAVDLADFARRLEVIEKTLQEDRQNG
jgi:hypothetical protein